ncbi:hypothetical protein GCK72_009382 [Caenorhabditis remanei]|uniref:Uncharacterized protein n=1 Tax=Caenorhabditis remanei TaxID=31234 RepID=A0A6A5H089_CAERE|nr:hypothetical protein GCK72_009382 [Caenorhabditis remanei]KAF1761128.1 hypothetical protein GCK72_009382 [Caenorhabditis remanei]
MKDELGARMFSDRMEALLPSVEVHRSDCSVAWFSHVNIERLRLINECSTISSHLNDFLLRDFPHSEIELLNVSWDFWDVLNGSVVGYEAVLHFISPQSSLNQILEHMWIDYLEVSRKNTTRIDTNRTMAHVRVTSFFNWVVVDIDDLVEILRYDFGDFGKLLEIELLLWSDRLEHLMVPRFCWLDLRLAASFLEIALRKHTSITCREHNSLGVKSFELLSPAVIKSWAFAWAHQRPILILLDTLHEEIRNPESEEQVTSTLLFWSSVLAE